MARAFLKNTLQTITAQAPGLRASMEEFVADRKFSARVSDADEVSWSEQRYAELGKFTRIRIAVAVQATADIYEDFNVWAHYLITKRGHVFSAVTNTPEVADPADWVLLSGSLALLGESFMRPLISEVEACARAASGRLVNAGLSVGGVEHHLFFERPQGFEDGLVVVDLHSVRSAVGRIAVSVEAIRKAEFSLPGLSGDQASLLWSPDDAVLYPAPAAELAPAL